MSWKGQLAATLLRRRGPYQLAATAPVDPRLTALAALVAPHLDGPRMLLDLDALDRNVARIQAQRNPALTLRLVDKSLPSASLLEHLMARLGTRAIMSFRASHLRHSLALDGTHVLMGKPLPEQAVQAFYAGPNGRAPIWLVDTPARAAALGALVPEDTEVALEIDVGLARGGASPATVRTLAQAVCAQPTLRLCGLMGYDAQVGQLPSWIEPRATSRAAADRLYQDCLAAVRDMLPTHPLLNGGGSPTARDHGASTPINDLALGSAFVLPRNFESPALADLEPAIFIASPVLKRVPGAGLPPALGLWSDRDTLYIAGGGWRCEPAHPPGLSWHAGFKGSANQAGLWVRANQALPDSGDAILLRPLIAEDTLGALGPILVASHGAIITQWPVYGP
jgi:D-serine deaminase-like pyridoxal phosphate-dependent protein